MGVGQGQESVARRSETLALIALISDAGSVTASYKISDTASGSERAKIADKLREIADSVGGTPRA